MFIVDTAFGIDLCSNVPMSFNMTHDTVSLTAAVCFSN